jgi:hypothetical protein
MSRLGITGPIMVVLALAGCGSQTHHAATTVVGNTRVTALCQEARHELLLIYDRNERKLGHSLARRFLETISRESVGVLGATIGKIVSLKVTPQQTGETQEVLRNLARHRALLVEYEREVRAAHEVGGGYFGGWIDLFVERAVACGSRRVRTQQI